MASFPNVIIHEVKVAGLYTGVVPIIGAVPVVPNVDSERGRIVKYLQCDDAGRIEPQPDVGVRLDWLTFHGDGTTNAKVILVDEDGHEYVVHEELINPSDFAIDPRQAFAPPGWFFKIVTVGVLSADGRVVFGIGPGWRPLPFHDIKYVGSKV